jgi:hypothetical protein
VESTAAPATTPPPPILQHNYNADGFRSASHQQRDFEIDPTSDIIGDGATNQLATYNMCVAYRCPSARVAALTKNIIEHTSIDIVICDRPPFETDLAGVLRANTILEMKLQYLALLSLNFSGCKMAGFGGNFNQTDLFSDYFSDKPEDLALLAAFPNSTPISFKE